jgi:predicted metal-dependent phosphoesterase TrpH
MVKVLRWAAVCLLLISTAIGTLVDQPRQSPRLSLGGYEVLAADFHIHSSPLSWGVLSPWDTVGEARHQGLDVIAMTPHNHTWVAKVGQWFSRSSDAPIVIVGEEIHSIGYHLLAIGISNTIPWRQKSGSAIDEVHRQGGVAIAAHPIDSYSAYDPEAMRNLDGAEVVHPAALREEKLASQMRAFFSRRRMTAIGDSDFHLGPMSPQLEMGLCRTFVFARERSERGVLDALREGHTVVYDRERAYGDPELIRIAAEDGRLPRLALTASRPRFTALISGILGVLGLLAWTIAGIPGTHPEI